MNKIFIKLFTKKAAYKKYHQNILNHNISFTRKFCTVSLKERVTTLEFNMIGNIINKSEKDKKNQLKLADSIICFKSSSNLSIDQEKTLKEDINNTIYAFANQNNTSFNKNSNNDCSSIFFSDYHNKQYTENFVGSVFNDNTNFTDTSKRSIININLTNSNLEVLSEFKNKEININLTNSTLNLESNITNCKLNITSNNSNISFNQIVSSEFEIYSNKDIIKGNLYDISDNSLLKCNNSNLKYFKISFWSALKFNIFYNKEEKYEKLLFLDREGYSFCPTLIVDNIETEFSKSTFIFYNPFYSLFPINNLNRNKIVYIVNELKKYTKEKSDETNSESIISTQKIGDEIKTIEKLLLLNKNNNKYYSKRTKLVLLFSFILTIYFGSLEYSKLHRENLDKTHTYLKYTQLNILAAFKAIYKVNDQ